LDRIVTIKQGKKAWFVKDTPGSGLAVFAAAGSRPIRGSKIANGPVVILSANRIKPPARSV